MPNTQAAATATQSDDVTIVVFKDNQASRSFQVSLRWISRLGLALGCFALATALSSFFALKYYRVARSTDPSHVADLEQQLSDFKTANRTLESKLAAGPAPAPATTQAAVNPLPVPTVTVTVTPVAAAAPPAQSSSAAPAAPPVGGFPLFSALPPQAQNLSADASKLPITVSPARTTWSGRLLKVDFNIQYVGTDHGSQQGRIVVLARGPNTLLGYPEGLFSRAGGDSLIVPQKGEYFSVSRFREVRAEFAEARGANPIDEIEIAILNLDGSLMVYQKTAVQQPAPKALPPAKAAPQTTGTPSAKGSLGTDAAKTPPQPKPKDSSSDLITPGVDQ